MDSTGWRSYKPIIRKYLAEVTCDLTNNKVLWGSSQNSTAFDSAFVNVATNLTAPGTFVGFRNILDGASAEQYSVAVGTGKYGVAYCTPNGDAKLVESNDGGVTWGAPQAIWNWNAADSTSTSRSIDLRYDGSTPQAIVGLLHVDITLGQFAPGFPSKVVFWSPAVNGGVPVKIDQADGLNGSQTTNDVFVSVTRGVISKNSAGALVVAYNKARQDTSDIGNNFFDVYLGYSVDNGATWSTSQVTNLPGQFQGDSFFMTAVTITFTDKCRQHCYHSCSG